MASNISVNTTPDSITLQNLFLAIEKDLRQSQSCSFLNTLPDFFLKIFLDKTFSSEHTDNRINIRNKILEHFADRLSPTDRQSFLDLEQIPQDTSHKLFFSISHTHAVGGFSVSTLPHGFDVEEFSRIKSPIVRRVSTSEELAQAPEPAYLWPAKEAVLKSFQSSDTVITDFIIHSWVSHFDTGLWSYRSTAKKSLATNINKGYLFLDSDHIFSIFFR